MLIEKKKYFLKMAEVVLDDERGLEISRNRKNYDHINIISYNQLPIDGFKLKKKRSARIKLAGVIDEVLSGFDSTCRKHIKRTFKMENLSFKMVDGDLDRTYSAYQEFERANGRTPFAKSSFKDMLIFNAYDGDEIISSIIFYDTSPSLKAHTIFSRRLNVQDKEKYKIISYATRRLVYEICDFALGKGYSCIDLGSVNFDDNNKSGITNFKLTFNPVIEEEYHYMYWSARFALINKIKKFFNSIKLFHLQ